MKATKTSAAKTAQELEEMFGITTQQIEKIDRDAAAGILHGTKTSTVTGPGRPPLFDEPMHQVTFKETEKNIQGIDKRAAQLGMKKSEYLRQLVENDLQCAGIV